MPTNKDFMRAALGQIVDPSNGRRLDEAGAIRHFGIDEETATVKLLIEVGVKAPEFTKEITRAAAKIVKLDYGFKSLVIEYEEKRKEVPATRLVVGIASGKGGVGKSSVTANLAYALKALGKKVGVIDADVYGANLPIIFDIDGVEIEGTPDEKIYPIRKDDIEIISAAFLMEPDKALMWRGPMLTKLLKIFFEDTLWSPDLDILLIDLPPGTGDVAMDVKSFAPDARMLIVTTPHESASQVAVKAGFAARQLGQELLGVVENMAYFEADGKQHFIFGKDGGKNVAAKLGIPLLGRIPIAQPQNGHHSIFAETEENGMIYLALAQKILRSFGA